MTGCATSCMLQYATCAASLRGLLDQPVLFSTLQKCRQAMYATPLQLQTIINSQTTSAKVVDRLQIKLEAKSVAQL